MLSLPDWIHARIRAKLRTSPRGGRAALSRQVGLSPSHVSAVASGVSQFDPEHWIAVATFYGESLADWVQASAAHRPPDDELLVPTSPVRGRTMPSHKAGASDGRRSLPLSTQEHELARARALLRIVRDLAADVGTLLTEALDADTEDRATEALRRLVRRDRRAIRRRTPSKPRA